MTGRHNVHVLLQWNTVARQTKQTKLCRHAQTKPLSFTWAAGDHVNRDVNQSVTHTTLLYRATQKSVEQKYSLAVTEVAIYDLRQSVHKTVSHHCRLRTEHGGPF